ncbi:Single-stranded DNA-binding protein [hydrothermal vent metagenome]|uniref:Single-stranded DNA-binding protein n=1 Tax=hydrothermal vent metagenome TaxID=652676 RepID=A0A1W1BD76_9ZZZZ
MYNKIILAGNLTRDVEVRYTQSGSAIGNTAIATSRKFKSATGEQKEEVLFVDLTFFGRTAEIANQYLRKGSKVLVDGRLKLDQWTAQDGSKRSKHSVTVENLQMLGSKDDAQSGGYNNAPAGDTYAQPAPSQPAPQAAPQQEQASNIPEIDINEDEIPF